MASQKNRMVNTIPTEKNKAGTLTPPDLKTSHNAMVIRTLGYWHRIDRQTNGTGKGVWK